MFNYLNLSIDLDFKPTKEFYDFDGVTLAVGFIVWAGTKVGNLWSNKWVDS